MQATVLEKVEIETKLFWKKRHIQKYNITSPWAGPAEQLKGGSRSRSSISCWVWKTYYHMSTHYSHFKSWPFRFFYEPSFFQNEENSYCVSLLWAIFLLFLNYYFTLVLLFKSLHPLIRRLRELFFKSLFFLPLNTTDFYSALILPCSESEKENSY